MKTMTETIIPAQPGFALIILDYELNWTEHPRPDSELDLDIEPVVAWGSPHGPYEQLEPITPMKRDWERLVTADSVALAVMFPDGRVMSVCNEPFTYPDIEAWKRQARIDWETWLRASGKFKPSF